MISFLLGRAWDLLYYTAHFGYRGGRALYYYYYNMDYPEVAEQKKKEAVIKELEMRIMRLEQLEKYMIPEGDPEQQIQYE